MILNPAQIAQLAYNAGFRGDALNIAVAIALAESGGNTNAYNPETAAGTPNGSGSRGLWQIYGVAHPEYNNNNAFDPVINAQAAFKVFREAGNRFTPWSTYNAGIINVQNYSSLIGGNTLANLNNKPNQSTPQATPNALSTSLQTSLSGATVKGGTGENQKPDTIQQLPEAIKQALTGGRSGQDLTFYLVGYSLVIITLIFLLVGLAGQFAGSDAGKAIIKTAATAAI